MAVKVACRFVLAALQLCIVSENFALPRSFLLPERDTTLIVKADVEHGFNFSYVLFIPSGTPLDKPLYLLVEPTAEDYVSDTSGEATVGSLGNYLARRLKIPLLVPRFPLYKKESGLNTEALDRNAMLVRHGSLKRLDEQLMAMITNSAGQLAKLHVRIHEQVWMTGCSTSGVFTNRFVALHPRQVRAAAYGGVSGLLILPIETLLTKSLNYPLGVNDLHKISGYDFDQQGFREVLQFVFMGANDNNDAVLSNDGFSAEDRQVVFKELSKTMMPDRWEKCQQVYEGNGINASFRTYLETGPGYNEKILADVETFFRKSMEL